MQDPLDLFERAVGTYPQNVAIVSADEQWSYEKLHHRALSYARYFAECGATRIAIGLPQCSEAYAAFLGAGMAGAYYSPLNLSAPPAKVHSILSRLRPHVIVADSSFFERFQDIDSSCAKAIPDSIPTQEVPFAKRPRHKIAYVMFTSGSTGEPKGVVVSRHALASYVDWIKDAFAITPLDRVSQQPNLAFDISMTDIYAALCFGASLHPVASDYDRMMPAQFVKQRRITVWNSTPSAISSMMRARQLTAESFESVRLVNFCGEPLFPEQVQAVLAAQPEATVHNTYGPTEATVAVTCATIRASDSFDLEGETSVHLGDAITHAEIRLLYGPSADEGEIVIFGDQLAEGYWEDAEKTDAVFVDVDGQRGYKTGDWAIRKGGKVYFSERIDFQVKVRGHRIELDEVSSAIRKLGWVVNVVVKHGKGLVAIVEDVPGLELHSAKFREDLQEWLEPYAIPDRVVSVDVIPRNQNDKLDRKVAAAQFLQTKK